MTKSDGDAPSGGKPRTGEVRHDDRGRAVWHWAADTARNALTSASQMLRKLDLSGLSLEDDKPSGEAGNPSAPGAPPSADRPAARGAGFNPYEGSTRSAPGQAPPRRSPGPLGKAPTAPVSARSSWWRRLFRRG